MPGVGALWIRRIDGATIRQTRHRLVALPLVGVIAVSAPSIAAA